MKPSFATFAVFVICAVAFATVTVQATLIPQSSLPAFPCSDALIAPDLPSRSLGATKAFTPVSQSPSPGYFETSEYMIGSVAVGVVFLESNGTVDPSTEDWTALEESQVVSEIQSGLSWLAAQDSNARVSFVYNISYRVPTSYEPITHTSWTFEQNWIGEAMTYLGYPGAYYFTQVRDYINSLRVTRNTDWAYAIFVVDSSNDVDGKFADNWFAYGYFGGPFVVMTYDNDGYTIGNMDFVTAHETCHTFYATDEYNGKPENSGYLNVTDNDGSGDMMDHAYSWWLCTNSRQQLGWRDTDGDGIHDIVDTFPDTFLTPYSPDPTNQSTLAYSGNVTEIPYPNKNPLISPTMRRNVTINTITTVQFRVGGGTWQNASSDDGAFDESEENFNFISALSSGTHFIETRGNNSVGNVETSFVNDTIMVDLTLPTTSLSYSSSSHVEGGTTYVSARTNFTLTASDTISGLANTYYRIDSGLWITYAGLFNLSGVSDGGHTIYFYSIDNAGNTETASSFYAVVDNTEPTLSEVIPSNETALATSNVQASWTGSDADSGIDHYETKIDSGSYVDKGTSTSHLFSSLSEGSHTIYIKAFDRLGNSKELITSFTVDVSAPTVSIDSPTPNFLTNSSSVTATWTGADIVSSIHYYEIRLDDGSWMNVSASTTYQLSAISDGSHELTVKAVDKAGNSAVSSVVFVVDTTPPLVSITFPTTGSEVRSSAVTVEWSGQDEVSGIDYYEAQLDGGSWINTGTDATYEFTLGDGSHTLNVRAVDKAGNYQEASVDFSVNTSLIGGPGWVDDIALFGLIGIAAVAIGFLFVKKRRKSNIQ